MDNEMLLDLLTNKVDNGEMTLECAQDIYKFHNNDTIVTEAMNSSDLFTLVTLAGFTILYTGSVIACIISKKKNEKKWQLYHEAMSTYPKKHDGIPDFNDFTRKRYTVSARDLSILGEEKDNKIHDFFKDSSEVVAFKYFYKNKECFEILFNGDGFNLCISEKCPSLIVKHKEYYMVKICFEHNFLPSQGRQFLEKEVKENEELKKKNGGTIISTKNLKNFKAKESADDIIDITTKNIYEAYENDTIDLDEAVTMLSYLN